MEDIRIRGESIKLDQFLKFSSAVQSGGQAKALIKEGEVSLNGEICLIRGKKLKDGDIVEIFSQKYKVIAGKE